MVAPTQTNAVTNQSVSGITLNIGDIAANRLSGTVTFTSMPTPAPYRIYIQARYGDDNWLNQATISMNGNTGSWSIPANDAFLEALESCAKTVTFGLYAQLASGENSIQFATVQQSVSKDDMSSVSLGSVAIPNFITLSGTVTATIDGQTPKRMYIDLFTDSDNWLAQVQVYPVVAGSNNWVTHIESLSASTTVKFEVNASNSEDGGWVQQEVNDVTTQVYNTDISNIALGTVTLTSGN
jgi:hypothetical protein